MKRSASIRLLLTGTVAGTSLASLVGCGSDSGRERIALSAANTYTNNHYVRGAGYFHAPYRAWFPYPYNSFMSGRGYFHGGQWSTEPDAALVQASQPAPEAVRNAQDRHDRTPRPGATRRSGFGGLSRFSGA